MKNIIRLSLFLTVLLTTAQAAELAYVNTKKVKLYQQTNYKSDVITQLKKDTELEVIQREGKWVKVKNSALQGWVPEYTLTSTKPSQEKVSFFNRLKSFFSSDSRRSRVSTISTAGGIRGLAEEEGESAGKKDYESLQKMEQISVTDEEVETFVEGNTN